MLEMEQLMERYKWLSNLSEKLITQTEVMEQLNLSRRQVYRLLKNFQAEGMEGIQHKKKSGRPPILHDKMPQIMALVADKYHDFGATLACEYLRKDGYTISKETLRQWRINDNLHKPKLKKSAKAHPSRQRRERNGELVQMDGSHHEWFEDRGKKCCLNVIIDDATSEIKNLFFSPTETTFDYMTTIHQYLKIDGRPLAVYADRHSIFTTTRPCKATGHYPKTQLHRALNDLDIELILARSPQAKGRVERVNLTLQDRLVKELRLKKISNIDDANKFMPQFIVSFNEKFEKTPQSKKDAHRAIFHNDDELKFILSKQYTKIISKNCQIIHENLIIQFDPKLWQNQLTGQEVILAISPDGNTTIKFGNTIIKPTKIIGNPSAPIAANHKNINQIVDQIVDKIA